MLSDVAQLVMGQSPPSTSYNDVGDGLPFYQGKTDFGATYPTPRIYCRDPKKIAEPGDILMSVRAPVGSTNLSNSKACIGRGIAAIRAHGIDRDFLYFYLKKIETYIDSLGSGAIFKAINKSQLAELPINEAGIPLPEQKQIAEILSTVQRAIEEQERIIQTTTELKKALMQKLFTEGLSRDRGKPQKQTEIGPVPESWEVVPLGELVSFTTGKLNSNAAVEDGEYPFFTCSKETFWIDHYAFDTEAILLSGNNAQAIYSVKHYKGKFNAYQRTYVITVKDTARISYRFLSQMLSRSLERLRVISIGSSTKYLTLGLLLNLPVAIPTYADGFKIGDWLDTTDQKINEHEAKRKTLQDLLRTLLHELMTAKTRVHKLEFEAPTFAP